MLDDSSGFSGAANRKPAILVVEDEVLIRIHVAVSLQDCGYETHEAGTGEEAIEVLKSTPIDLVFTDITLPGEVDGFGLLEWVRSEQPKLPVILASGLFDIATVRERAKEELFVNKPYDLNEVEAVIRRLLGPSHLHQ